MTFETRYIPPSSATWQGRSDLPPHSSFYQIMQMLNLQETITQQNKPALALLGFNCDEGIRRNSGRLGAAQGPQFIRESLAKLPIHRHDIICYDAGDITCEDNNLEAAQTALGEAVYLLMKNNITPIILGGGHELAWGHYQGIAKKFPKENLNIVNFDAHFDMRPLVENKGNSGTPFLQIANAQQTANLFFHYTCLGVQNASNIDILFATAKNFRTHIITADEIHQNNTSLYHETVQNIKTDEQLIYLSICLDVFAAAYAPGVSAPQVLGLTPWQVIPAIRKLAASKKAIGYDIAELSPPQDIDLHTAKLAANLIYEIVHHHQI